uniref:glucuronosyltransferase n=1 Tax=Panagrolaimus davidi TaxID=227884 RepID=A0A914QY32_9BILA
MKITTFIVVAVLCFISIGNVSSLRILVYQTALGRSHVQHIGSVVDTLVEAGHDVDLIIQVWNTHVTINGTDKAKNIWRIEMPNSPWFKMGHMQNAVTNERISFFDEAFLETRSEYCNKLVSDTKLMKQLKIRRYDVLVSSCWDGCAFGIAHILGIRATTGVFATPLMFYTSALLGINGHPSYITDDLYPTKVGGKLSLTDRWENLKFIFHTWFNLDTLFYGEVSL